MAAGYMAGKRAEAAGGGTAPGATEAEGNELRAARTQQHQMNWSGTVLKGCQ
jgi:hypothetical protein